MITENQTISILGCGWYGFALGQDLVQKGFKVNGTSTTEACFDKFIKAGITPFRALFESDSADFDPVFFNCDVLIISIPPKSRSAEGSLFAKKIERIKNVLLEKSVKKVILISSISVYGDHNKQVNEHTLPMPDNTSGKIMLDAENILKDQNKFALTILRFGGLFGPGRDPAKFFAGKKNIPNGKAPVNLIHLDDCIGVTNAILNKNAFGHTFNGCSISHPEKMDFYLKTALKSNLPAPEFIAELREWKIISSAYTKEFLEYSFGTIV